jgi:hypothetical protein
MHLQELGMILPRRPVADRLGVADGNRIGGFEPGRALILDVDRGHAIAGCGHDER